MLAVESNYLWRYRALQVLKEATKDLLVDLLDASKHSAIHAKRRMIMTKDMQLARRILGHLGRLGRR